MTRKPINFRFYKIEELQEFVRLCEAGDSDVSHISAQTFQRMVAEINHRAA